MFVARLSRKESSILYKVDRRKIELFKGFVILFSFVPIFIEISDQISDEALKNTTDKEQV